MDKTDQKKASDQMQADLDAANKTAMNEHLRNTAPNPTAVAGGGPIEIPPVPHHGHEGVDPIVPHAMRNPPYVPENNPNPYAASAKSPERDPRTGRAVGTPTNLGGNPGTEQSSYVARGTASTWDGKQDTAENPLGGSNHSTSARPPAGKPSGNP